MIIKRFCCVALLLSLMTSAGFADEIARTALNGRTIIVDSNGTWKYEEAVTSTGAQVKVDCTQGAVIKSKKLPISVCVSGAWRIDSKPPGAMELFASNSELDIYFGLIAERTIMPLAGLRDAILFNAAQSINLRPEDVPILSESKIMIGKNEWSYIEYDVTSNGSKFRFGNYYSSLGNLGIAQVVFWSSDVYFDQNKPTITEFMNLVAVNP